MCASCTAQGAPSPSSSSAPPSSSLPPEPQPNRLPEMPLAEGANALTGQALPEGFEPGQRPVAVMVSNNLPSLPQRGLASADVVFEMLTEGGITRLMAMYADYRAVPQVGPVRSTRDQFLQFAVPSNAVLVHIGSSVYARNLLNVLDYQDIDGLYLGSTSFVFDVARTLPKGQGKLNEYCWFTDGSLIATGMQTVGLPFTGEVRSMFLFSEEPAVPQDTAYHVGVSYSDAAVSDFYYDAASNLYYKSYFGGPHTDEGGAQLTFTNLILLSAPIGLKPDGLCTEFDLRGGEGYYFTAGGVQKVLWEKGAANRPLRLFDEGGNDLHIQPGRSYVGVVPLEREGAVSIAPAIPAEPVSAPPAVSTPPVEPPVVSTPPAE